MSLAQRKHSRSGRQLPRLNTNKPPYGLLNFTSNHPGSAYVDDVIAKGTRLIALNRWMTQFRDDIKARDSSIICLCYISLTDVRSWDPTNVNDNGPTGISYNYAVQQAANGHDWFLRRGGGYINQAAYPGQLQMQTYNPEYQRAWRDAVVKSVSNSGWDGVLADNDLADNGDYYNLLPNDQGATLTDIASGCQQMIAMTGPALNRFGKLFVPNITEGHIGNKWQADTRWGGGLAEMYAHWSESDNEGFFSYDYAGYLPSVTPGANIAFCRSMTSPTYSTKAIIYGLASFLIAGGNDNGVYFSSPKDQYELPPSTHWTPEQGIIVGSPAGAIVRPVADVITRAFTKGWAAINQREEGTAPVAIAVPPGYLRADNTAAGTSVTLAPHTGVVFKRL